MKQTSQPWVKLPVLLLIIALAAVLLTATAMADSPSPAPASADTVHAPAVPTLPSTTYISASASGSVKGNRFKSSDILSYVSSTGTWSVFKTGSALGLPQGNHEEGRGVNLLDFEVLPNGDIIFAIDRTKTITGLGKVTPRDVLRSSAGHLSFELVGSTVGLTTSSENIDAVAWSQNNKLLISTVGSATINGIAGKVQDEDLVEITGANGALYFVGSAINLKSNSEDIAAAAVDSTSADKILYLATKGSFTANSLNAISGRNTDVFGLIPNSSSPVKIPWPYAPANSRWLTSRLL